MRYDVFLSYSSNDEPITQEAMRAMEATGIRCWLAPRELTAGDMWAAELVAAIDASRLMTIFLSRSAGESPHVLREVNRAVHKRLGLIVFRIENFPLSAALEYYLGPVHWLDATAPPVESHLAHLCDAILRLNPLGAPGAPGQPQLDPALFQPAWPPAEHPLLGRDAELAVLDRVWSAAMGGRARAVIVQGEAGSGKTRLLQELLMKHSGEPLFILVARALPEDARSPYEAIASALDPVIRLGPSMGLPAEALAEVERVRTRAYPDATPQQAQERRHWALAEFLRALCHRAPVVLFLDDVQWADDISLAFVQSLLIRNPRERIIILSTMRTDDTRSASPALLKFQNYLNKAELLTEITLAPLDPASSSQLCRAWLGRPMTSELHERLYAFTEGNPYFLFQTLYSLAERRILIPGENPAPALAHTATQQQLQVPTSVRQAISLRTETLPAKTKDILNAAAVMGRQFGPALVQRVAGVTEAQLDRALSQLCERQIIVARENAYDFRHGMTREAVYAGINFHLRRKLHGQVFAALAASLRPAATAIEVQRLAYHAARAERWPEAFRFALQAGQMAWELFEVETARDYLEQAWNIASVHLPDLSQDDRLRCFEGLGDVYTTLGQFDDARKMFQDALDLPLVSARLHARVLLKIAEAYDHQGQLAAAAQWLEDALQALHADMEDALCAQICSQYSINRLKQGQITEAWTWAERACVTDSAQLHLLKAVLHRSSGEQERALGECDRAIALAKRPYNPVYLARGYTNRGVILSELNRWGEARQAHEEALATLATTHDMRIYAGAHCNLSDVCRHLGELESAQRLAETALHVATTLELHYEEALAHLNCGAALLEAGDPYRARTHHFEVAKRILQDHAIGQFRAEVERGIATAHLQAGRVSEAETAALAEIALATDPASPSPSDEGSGWRVLGDVRRTQARWQEAEEAFGRSIELLRQHGPKFELGLAYLDLARLLIDLERKDEAREASAAARPIFSEAGARLVLARVDTLDACLTDEIR